MALKTALSLGLSGVLKRDVLTGEIWRAGKYQPSHPRFGLGGKRCVFSRRKILIMCMCNVISDQTHEMTRAYEYALLCMQKWNRALIHGKSPVPRKAWPPFFPFFLSLSQWRPLASVRLLASLVDNVGLCQPKNYIILGWGGIFCLPGVAGRQARKQSVELQPLLVPSAIRVIWCWGMEQADKTILKGKWFHS